MHPGATHPPRHIGCSYTDGASALDGFKTARPNLAILDIKMPRMDGMETLRRLRQKSDLPVIADR